MHLCTRACGDRVFNCTLMLSSRLCVLFTLPLFFWLLAEGSQVPASPGSFASVIGSIGLKDVDLSEDGSELAAKLYSLLTGD